MATLAAMGAFYTFSEQREESRRNQFEQNFNTLLANFQSIARQIDISILTYDLPSDDIPEQYWEPYAKEVLKMQGRDALRRLLSILREDLSPSDFSDSKVVSRVYDGFYDRWMDDLGHYFRCLYHLMRLISESCPKDRFYYSRIVRAHLSNSEQVLLAYNCIFGEGRFEFVKYVEEFSMLHNMHRRNLNELHRAEMDLFVSVLPGECFRFDTESAFTYDSIPPRGI
ncbi:MAG TPA: putative phage abortive infection protein [Sphingomonas sp.]|nr:putative phage abortive infection protein [Sphingomonas sp.]